MRLLSEALASRMKELEVAFDQRLPEGCPFVVRLDGVAFRKLTARLEKPFDQTFTRTMLKTAAELLTATVARTAFVQSDEISLVFAPEASLDQTIYSGRIQKIASTMASLAGAHFNHWFGGRGGRLAHFDARVFAVPDAGAAADAIYWRHKFDCRRNAINMIGCRHLSHSKMQGLQLRDLLELLQRQHGIDPFKDYSPMAVYGTFVKRVQVPHVGWNPITRESVPTLRTRLEARSFDWERREESEESPEDPFILAKCWEPSMPKSLISIEI